MKELEFPDLARPGHLEVLATVGRHPGSGVLRFGGGTALSLVYLGHRLSVDLDFFVATREERERGVRVIIDSLRELEYPFDPDLSAPSHARFVADLGETRLKIDVLVEAAVENAPCDTLSPHGVQVLPLQTLFLLKAKAAASRQDLDRLKDLVDLLVMLERGATVPWESLEHEAGLLDDLVNALSGFEDLLDYWPDLQLQEWVRWDQLVEQHRQLLRLLMAK